VAAMKTFRAMCLPFGAGKISPGFNDNRNNTRNNVYWFLQKRYVYCYEIPQRWALEFQT
jgi:hypothetical protein